jgi:hypothetical protein
MVCRYCGLESAVSHASAHECVAALQREGNLLREQLQNGEPGVSAATGSTDDRSAARAVAPRLTLVHDRSLGHD